MEITYEEGQKQGELTMIVEAHECVDAGVLERLANMSVENICQVDYSDFCSSNKFKIPMDGKIKLKELDENGLDSDTLKSILQQIFLTFQELRMNQIHYNFILADPEYLLFDKETSLPFLICVPVVRDCNADSEVTWTRNYIAQLPYQLDASKDVIQILNYLNRKSIEEDQRFRCIELLNEIEKTEIKVSIEPEETIREYKDVMSYVGQVQGSVTIDIEPVVSLQPIEQSFPEEVQASREVVFNETTILNAGTIGETTVLGQQMTQETPHLIREKNHEKVSLNKWLYIIGKEVNTCDYAVRDNTNVSRNHIKVLVKGNQCYVVDNYSTNHTYINGEMLESGVEIEIKHGARLRLADEVFVFYQR